MGRAWSRSVRSACCPIVKVEGWEARSWGRRSTRRRAGGEPAVILLGAPAYYGRLGFLPASRYGLRNPFAGETDQGFMIAEEDFQIAVLNETRTRELSGEVRWHAAFG